MQYRVLVPLWGARGKVIEPGTVVDTIPEKAAPILLAKGMIEEIPEEEPDELEYEVVYVES